MEFMILILFGYDSKKVLRKGEKNVKENDFFSYLVFMENTKEN